MTFDALASATAAPAAEMANQDVSISFRSGGLQRPRWDMVRDDYRKEADFIEVAPVFTATVPTPYTLTIHLDSAVFVGKEGQQPTFTLFDGDDSVVPIIDVGVLDSTRQRVTVTWLAPDLAPEWQRWIYCFFVESSTGCTAPLPLAFVYLPKEAEQQRALASRMDAQDSTSAGAAGSNVSTTPTLFTTIQIVQSEPNYPQVFDYTKVNLPDGIYPDPMIRLLERGRPFNLSFWSGVGTFSEQRASRDQCNRGLEEHGPLAIRWKGVTNPNDLCEDPETPHGFFNSAVTEIGRTCTVMWNEPLGPSGGGVSSFLFDDVNLEKNESAVLDPTVINDLPQIPPGIR